MPDVSTKFEVVRNAPGLITDFVNGRPLAAVSRLSGPAVSSDNPLTGGELVNLFGTGFGPHRISPPEGFGVSESDAYRISDPVQLMVGDEIVAPDYTGSADGSPGVIVVRFRTPHRLSEQDMILIKVVVNGVVSNEAVLPTAVAYSINTGGQTDVTTEEHK
jgi:uncharacterized protein (TIGR03437 family)